MVDWKEIEARANADGHIPDDIYTHHVQDFSTCPPQTEEARKFEAEVWQTYLSARRWKKTSNMYSQMYRYEWYEGRKRNGFWGNIERAVTGLALNTAPRITIFSAGNGRDLLKVGLAAGIWRSRAPQGLKGTHKEINPDFFELNKPDARIMVTEYDMNNLEALRHTVTALIQEYRLKDQMVAIRRWDFRRPAPVAAGTQDLAVFSLTGNYATLDEQACILKEIGKCVKPGGHLVASTMSPRFSFSNALTIVNKLRLFFSTPLAWPVALEFYLWQNRWGKMAAAMGNKGYWENAPADQWIDFLHASGLRKVAVYPAPSRIVPVEVLVARKNADSGTRNSE